MSQYNLDSFLENLFEWVDSFKIDNEAGHFSLIRGKNKPSLYGICDIVFNLVIPNQLDKYISFYEIDIQMWIKQIQSYQVLKTGWFKDRYFNYKFRSPLTGQWEHCTAFATSVLKLLETTPKYSLEITKKLNTKKKVEWWLNKVPEWGFLYWPGSHKGGGIGAIFATLEEDKYPHKDFFNWYFDWLDDKADPEIGFWRLGWNHKISKSLTKHELGDAVHYYWIYEFMGHPIQFPEKVIDSTLKLQNELGLWDKDISYCIDFDAIFSLLRCCRQTKGYRKEDVKDALVKYLDYTVPCLNDREFLFNRYENTHKLTGCLEAIAEIYKFMPELFDLPKPWIETLDITPWI
ncbi:MAG: hypothetical protein ACFFBZ_14670 [Promethearchaeota archaeon]